MIRIRNVAVASALVTALAIGCTINENNAPPAGNHANDGTTTIDSTAARALVMGQVDASVQGNVHFHVNAELRDVVLAPDSTFVVRDVPTGTVTLTCDTDDVTGTLTIKDVKPGEIISVTVRREGASIIIVITERTQSTEPPREVDGHDGDALEITSSHVCYWFKPGHYKRDVIVSGDDVHLFGASHNSCVVDDLTFIDKKLEIRGNNVTVFDVELRGELVISGKNAHVEDTCTKCFNEGCGHACNDDDDHHGSCGDHPGAHDDGGVTGTTDAGVSVDSGTNADGGVVSSDGGVSTDAAPADAMPQDAASGG